MPSLDGGPLETRVAGKYRGRPSSLRIFARPNARSRARSITIPSPTFRTLDCVTPCVGYDGLLPATSYSPHPAFQTEFHGDSNKSPRMAISMPQYFSRADSSGRRSPKQIHKQKQKQKLTRRASMSVFTTIIRKLSSCPRNIGGLASGRRKGLFRRVPPAEGDDCEMGLLCRAGTNEHASSGRKRGRMYSMDSSSIYTQSSMGRLNSLEINQDKSADSDEGEDIITLRHRSPPATPRTADTTTSCFAERELVDRQQRAKMMSRIKSVQLLGVEACRAVWEQR